MIIMVVLIHSHCSSRVSYRVSHIGCWATEACCGTLLHHKVLVEALPVGWIIAPQLQNAAERRCLKSCALGVKTTLSCFEPRCLRFISILYQNECRIIMMDNVGMCQSVDTLQPFVWLAGFFTLQRLSHLFWKARCRVKRILVADSGRGGSWKCQELRGADSSEVFRRRVVNNHWPSTISLWILFEYSGIRLFSSPLSPLYH